MKKSSLRAVLWLTIAGCGGASQSPTVAATTEAAATAATTLTPQNARALSATATFGDLVRSARTLDDHPEEHSTAGCLVGGGAAAGAAFDLRAEIAVAVRPLPDAAADLDAVLREGRLPVRIFSRFGQVGPSIYDVALVAMTYTPPLRDDLPAVALFATARGIYVRATSGTVAPELADSVLAEDVEQRVAAITPDGRRAIYVTAEEAYPLTALRPLLARLSRGTTPVALAAPLARDTRLPEPTPMAAIEATRGMCPNGEAPTFAETAAEGDVDPNAVRARLTHFVETASTCLSKATSARTAQGGNMRVGFVLNAEGNVSAACATSDEIRDRDVRVCVIEALRTTPFDRPSPAGYVQLEVPLVLRPLAETAPKALCE